MADTAFTKVSLRAAMLDRRQRLTASEQRHAEQKVAYHLPDILPQEPVQNIGLYWSFQGELPTHEIFNGLKKPGRTLYLPRFNTQLKELEMVKVDEENQLILGALGFKEPEANLPAVSVTQLDVILVPGVAFDNDGVRLGRGKGLYDKLLERFSGYKTGLAYDFQIMEKIPSEPWDVSMDSIVTEQRVIRAQ